MAAKPTGGTELCLIVEAENASLQHLRKDDELKRAIEAIGVLRADDLEVQVLEVESAGFNEVKNMDMAPRKKPVLFEVYLAPKQRCVVRARLDLDHYDGVSAMHTIFNVLEFAEHGKQDALSPFAFSNPEAASSLMAPLRMLGVMGMALLTFLWHMALFFMHGIEAPISSPWTCWRASRRAETHAQCARYQLSAGTRFRDMTRILDGTRRDQGFAAYICTVNFRPLVALSRVRTLEDLASREARSAGVFVSPDHPKMQGASAAFVAAGHVFMNNYGRWDPNVSADVTGVYWDWPEVPEEAPFVVFTQTVQGKTWVVLRSASNAMPTLRKYFDVLGAPEQFVSITAAARGHGA